MTMLPNAHVPYEMSERSKSFYKCEYKLAKEISYAEVGDVDTAMVYFKYLHDGSSKSPEIYQILARSIPQCPYDSHAEFNRVWA